MVADRCAEKRPAPPPGRRADGGRLLFRRPGQGLLTVLMLIGIALLGPTGHAQLTELDEAAFIRGLAERELDSLVSELAENPPDDVEEAGALLGAMVSDYLALAPDGSTWDRRFDQVQRLYRRLTENAPAGAHQPVLIAGRYAQSLLFVGLPSRQRADLFVPFGLATPDQQRATAQLAGEAYDAVVEGLDRWAGLPRRLRVRRDFVSEYVNTGIWADLQEVTSRDLPYYRAWAIAYLAQPKLAQQPAAQRIMPDAARRGQLLALAAKDATFLIDRYVGENSMLLDEAQALMLLMGGQIRLLNGQTDQATALFLRAAQMQDAESATRFTARVAVASAHAASGDQARALSVLDQLRNDPFAQSNPLYQILLTDVQVKMIRARAAQADGDQRRQLLLESYEPYTQLLSGDRIDPQYKPAVEQFLFDRWSGEVVEEVDIRTLPPVVRFAVGKQALTAGQSLMQAGDQAQARQRFARAVSVLQPLSQGENLSAEMAAQVRYTLGAAQYFGATNPRQQLEAVNTFVELAQAHPDQPEAAQAINVAVSLGAQIYQRVKQAQGLSEQAIADAARPYENALRVLIDRFSVGELAELARQSTYSLAALLREQARYEQAIEAYERVPDNHRYYVEAQYEKLVCLGAMWADAAPATRSAMAQRVLLAYRQFDHTVSRALRNATDPQRRDRLQRYQHLAMLTKADVLIESANQPDEALTLLEQVPDAYQSQKMRLRIRAYQRMGEYEQASQLVDRFMTRQPDVAGPLVIGVLKSMNSQIESARQENDQQTVRQLGQVAAQMLDKLLDWAADQPDIQNDPQKKLAFEVMVGQVQLAAGEYEQASATFDQLYQTDLGRQNLQVVQGLAESRYQRAERLANRDASAQAVEQAYRASADLYSAIIRNYQEHSRTKDHDYWQAQMRIHQMMDATGVSSRSIYASINRMQRSEPELGGEPFRSVLQSLLLKHAPE
jgi:tetratricopeptide (TPR) repeat protein